MTNEEKLNELLKQRGLSMDQVPTTSLEDIPAQADGCAKLMDVYYTLKNTVDMEYPYWYNRVWQENDGDMIIVRRAKAMAAALSHLTPFSLTKSW